MHRAESERGPNMEILFSPSSQSIKKYRVLPTRKAHPFGIQIFFFFLLLNHILPAWLTFSFHSFLRFTPEIGTDTPPKASLINHLVSPVAKTPGKQKHCCQSGHSRGQEIAWSSGQKPDLYIKLLFHHIPSIPNLSVIIMKRCWVLSNAFLHQLR